MSTMGNPVLLRDRAAVFAPFAADGQPQTFLDADEQLDVAAAEARFGVPRALLALAEGMLRSLPPPIRSDFVLRWTAAAADAGNLGPVAGQFILWMFEDEAFGIMGPVRDAAVRDVVLPILAAHRRLLAGDAPSRRDWSALRGDLLAAAPGERPKPEAAAIAAAESVAWPPSTTMSAARGAWWSWIPAQDAGIEATLGWTADDQAAMVVAHNRLMALAQEETAAGRQVDFDAMFMAEEPELGARWTAFRQEHRNELARRMGIAVDRLVALILAA